MKERKLSPAIIDRTVGLPCTATYRQNFGSLRNVYRLIGYTSKRDCDYIDTRQRWTDLTVNLASQIATATKQTGRRVTFDSSNDCLRVNGHVNVSFRVARWLPRKLKTHSSRWSIQRRASAPPGWIVAIRLGERNETLLDYLLLPTPKKGGALIRFSEKGRAHHRIARFERFDALVRALIPRVAERGRDTSTRPSRSKLRTRGHFRNRNGRVSR